MGMGCGYLPDGKERTGRGIRLALRTLLSAAALLGAGCANLRVTDPSRTATEQFLLSEAAKKAVAPMSFDLLHARRAYVDSTYFASVDKDFVLGELRSKLLLSGVQLVDKREEAEVVIEVRSAGLGIDRYESLFGIPSLGGPAGAAGAPVGTIVTPEVALTKKVRQIGFASVAYVAYWVDTGQVLASSSPLVGRAYREDWWLLGFGPNTLGTIPPVDHKRDHRHDSGM